MKDSLRSFARTLISGGPASRTQKASGRPPHTRLSVNSLEDRVVPAYLLGGPAAGLTSLSGVWSWDNGTAIDAPTGYRGALTNPANFGPAGTVPVTITASDLATVTPATLAPLSGFISTWWHDSQSAASVPAVTDFFLAGGDLILLDDDSTHDAIGAALGIPSSSSTGSVSNDGAPLFNGPFGTAVNVSQQGSVGQLSAADIASKGGHVGATNADGKVTAAYWNAGDYAPGAGRMVIVADIDMYSLFYGNVSYAPLNDNGRFALNGAAFIVGDDPPVLTVGDTALYVENAAPVVVAPSLTLTDIDGPNLEGASVAIGTNFNPAQDSLAFTPQAGVTGSYNPATGILTLTGSGSAADYQAVLRSVTYSNNSDDPSTGARSVEFTIGSSLFNPATGHYYEFVSIPNAVDLPWTTARTQAAARSLFGLQGYLATITSAGENAFAAAKLTGTGWIGGSDAAVEGEWRWVTGPEGLEAGGQGRQFWQGPGNGSPVGGSYTN